MGFICGGGAAKCPLWLSSLSVSPGGRDRMAIAHIAFWPSPFSLLSCAAGGYSLREELKISLGHVTMCWVAFACCSSGVTSMSV